MGKFKVAAVFSNNMVLQRGCAVNVFGEGDELAGVTVSIDGIERSSTVHDGRWLVQLPPHSESGALTMTVSCGKEKCRFTNVVYGEVWLAGGQSNMEFELQNCKESGALTADKNPNVRFYYTQKKLLSEEDFYACEAASAWSEFDENSAKCWSAVGYFFARELAKRLGVTVGVIGCNWGGTSASAWTGRERLQNDIELKTYLDEYDNAIAGKSDEQLKSEWAEHQEYQAQWQKKIDKFYAENPNGAWDDALKAAGECTYPGPLNPNSPFRAVGLYESMISRVCPYTLKGFIYYQGESDDHKPQMYYKLFRELIGQWRDDWGSDSLPFLFVQLPMHRYEADEDSKNWCLIREAQMKVFNTVKNTGICVALDKGEFNEIHPKSKQPIGERLALQALYRVYGDSTLRQKANSPMFKAMERIEGGLELQFSYCDGFIIKGKIAGFEIAGADNVFCKAIPEIRGNRIFISSPEVSEPLHARYCWTNYGPVTVFGLNELPLAPFRA